MVNHKYLTSDFWDGKRVFITGHTGFKGTWLSIILTYLGANVYGYSLQPTDRDLLFINSNVSSRITSQYNNILNLDNLALALEAFSPQVVFHLAAQPLVSTSYRQPLETLSTNIIGTANLLTACLSLRTPPLAIINVTTDKVYSQLPGHAHVETDRLGGSDPYSCSKACSELISQSLYASYAKRDTTGIATARSGNVIGGGDFSPDRLIPDIYRSISTKSTIAIRNPSYIRPWQHVLEPLCGYLSLAHHLVHHPSKYSSAWNFGPSSELQYTVTDVLNKFQETWTSISQLPISIEAPTFKENPHLTLNSTKAKTHLDWQTLLSFDQTLYLTAEWYKRYHNDPSYSYDYTLEQFLYYCDIIANETD